MVGGAVDWLPWVVGVLLLVALAVGAVLVRRRRRPVQRPATRRPAQKPVASAWVVRPRAGDIWWADVPFEDGTGGEVRPRPLPRVGRARAAGLHTTTPG